MTLLLVPLLLSGQAFREHGAIAWQEMMILKQPNSNSVFYPSLTENTQSTKNRQLLVAVSNPFMIKGLNRLGADWYQNLDHSAWGVSTGIQSGGPVSSISLSADYTQIISSSIAMGLKMHVQANRWQGYGSQKNGGIKGKILYRINDKTSWTSSFSLDKSGIKSTGSTRKSWSTEMGQTLNKALFLAIRLEKADERDPVLQMMFDWKMNENFSLIGGINIASGNIMLGWHHSGKHTRKGLNVNSHSLLGYGLEIFYSHGWD